MGNVVTELLRLSAWGLAGAFVVFALTYVVYLRTDNASIVDAVWSYTLGGLGVLYAALATGDLERRRLVGLLAAVWGWRLGTHLLVRIRGAAHEDERYARLRDDWRRRGWNVRVQMARFYAGQWLSTVVLALPFAIAVREPSPMPTWQLVLVAALFFVAWRGESLADAQLRAFKRDPANRGRVCDVGLWGWSRHPNYFFEWLVWVAFALAAVGAPWWWVAWGSPAIILYLLLKVTGIPLTEAHMVASRGEAYVAYQRRVSMFVPRPPRPPRDLAR